MFCAVDNKLWNVDLRSGEVNFRRAVDKYVDRQVEEHHDAGGRLSSRVTRPIVTWRSTTVLPNNDGFTGEKLNHSLTLFETI